ncbi:SDR family oxidoreductase [Sphingobium boeckii]|uniref:Uncharacterized protein YbjT (DUF2867 family) n=1 Tax=Sphingobium boeckii TaxID=1082345 RepID=A0A7W9AFV0_9SPHN|nr:NmrA family NAD(P)-binding protein [Sphingobium boeckii]MBB5684892.1 uncharacterized protein YbjT (DUF2867 family) [Sphingobium boeckii]
MMQTGLIAVIGASGQTGGALLSELAGRNRRIRGIGRHPKPPTEIEWCTAELGDVRSLLSAIEGAAAIHYIPPVFDSREEEFGRNVIAAAEAAHCPRIVYHSVLHAATPDMLHHWRKARVELHLRHSPLEWTILQPAMYAQTVLAFLDRANGTLTPGFDITRPFTPVALQDLSRAAAVVLTEPGHGYATYELAGPERLDFGSMARQLSDLLGRPVTAVAGDAAARVEAVAAGLGFGPSAAAELRAMLDHYDRYGLVGNSNVLRQLLGRDPTPFREALRPALESDRVPAAI